MKYYIIAGEASGDLHGSNLIKELKKIDTGAEIRCWGGDLMKEAGADLVMHYKDLAFMGWVEVVKHLPTIFRNLRFCKEDILLYKPGALILIDYPGFNLRIAKWAHEQGLRIIYYISPQVWAWKEGRVKSIKKCVDKMLVILPFEKEFYRKWNYEVEYVGHPLVEVVDSFRQSASTPPGNLPTPPLPSEPRFQPSPTSAPATLPSPEAPAPAPALHSAPSQTPATQPASGTPTPAPPSRAARPVIALLPGSRKQEILKKLPVMLQVSSFFPDHEFVVAKAPGQEDVFYESLLAPYPNVSSVRNQTYSLLLRSQAACVTSGTATLETALFGVPEVVCYKSGAFQYQLAKKLIRVKYISLVNLIMDKEVVKELIQDDLTPENLRRELSGLLNDSVRQQQLRTDYQALKDLLSQGGHASANAARSIIKFLGK